jgi:hypothetical protein
MRIFPLQSRPAGDQQPGTHHRPALLAALVLVLALAIAPAAHANVAETIILRCTNNQSLSGFSQAAYNAALRELNADLEEYSPQCASEIREAERAAAVGGHTSGAGAGGGGAAVAVAATPSEQRAITHALKGGSEPVKLAGATIKPGVIHVDAASALSSLPTPLLATLAFLLACLLLVAGGALRNHLRARRAD